VISVALISGSTFYSFHPLGQKSPGGSSAPVTFKEFMMGLDIYFFSKTPDSEKLEEVDYFRKVNPLVKWVENNIAPVENCENIKIEKEHLAFLQATLEKLDETNCHLLFPTTNGFFFGSTNYDGYYWGDVKEVKDFVGKVLNTFDFDNQQLIFHANW